MATVTSAMREETKTISIHNVSDVHTYFLLKLKNFDGKSFHFFLSKSIRNLCGSATEIGGKRLAQCKDLLGLSFFERYTI